MRTRWIVFFCLLVVWIVVIGTAWYFSNARPEGWGQGLFDAIILIGGIGGLLMLIELAICNWLL